MRRPRVDVHRHGAATAGADHDIGIPLTLFGLGDADGLLEIVVGQVRVENFVPVVFEVGRLQAARCRLPAVEEEDEHGGIVAGIGWPGLLSITGKRRAGWTGIGRALWKVGGWVRPRYRSERASTLPSYPILN